MKKVLFVSKPIAPPWHDGSKNLVRDIATHLTRAQPTVMTTASAAALGGRVAMDPIYRDPGGFSPSVLTNARVVRRLLTDRQHDVWHFVFAPNVASSSAARVAITARRALGWKGHVVQTIASAPRHFERAPSLLFGDVVVALTEWTRGRLLAEGVDGAKLRVIPACSLAPRAVPPAEIAQLREELDLGTGPVFLYPGDYEVSHGAETVARAVSAIVRAVPEARVVFACRPKTARAAAARAEVEHILTDAHVLHRTRHVGQMTDIVPLLATSAAVLFPVDDLYGKVDLPLILLEAMSLGIPMVLARGGPLEALSSGDFVDPGDAPALASAAVRIVRGSHASRGSSEQLERGRALYATRFTPAAVAAQYDELYEQL